MTEFVDFLSRWGVPIVIAIAQLIIAWVVWSLRIGFTTKNQCETHRAKQSENCDQFRREQKRPADKASKDVADLKSQISSMPSRSEIRALTKELGEMNKAIGKLEGRLGGIGRAVDLVNQHLINHGSGDK